MGCVETPRQTHLVGEKSLKNVKKWSCKKVCKGYGYFWDTFGRVEWHPGPQNRGGNLLIGLSSIPRPNEVPWSPLTLPKVSQKQLYRRMKMNFIINFLQLHLLTFFSDFSPTRWVWRGVSTQPTWLYIKPNLLVLITHRRICLPILKFQNSPKS